MTTWHRPTSRHLVAWIAIAAMLLLLVRPVCELLHANQTANSRAPATQMLAHDPGDDALPHGNSQCCLDASSSFVVSLIKILGSSGVSHPTPLAPPFVPVTALVLTLLAVLTISWPRPSRRTCASFYLRSARILR